MSKPDDIHRNLRMEILVGIRLQQDLRRLDSLFKNTKPYRGRTLVNAGQAAIDDAVYNMDVHFLDGIHDDCIGIGKLKQKPSYKLLQAIEADDSEAVSKNLRESGSAAIKNQNFFKFKDRNYRSYFLTLAHAARSPQMITTLHTYGADFKGVDSEGRLPAFFIARYAKSHLIFPLLCQVFNINANDSGKVNANDHSPLPEHISKYLPSQNIYSYDTPHVTALSGSLKKKMKQTNHTGEVLHADLDQILPAVFDPPIIRALKYYNLHALRGLTMLPPAKIDLNIRHSVTHMTPLIYAVIKADEAIQAYSDWYQEVQASADRNKIIPIKVRKWEAAKAVWAVKFLASLPGVDPNIMDTTNATAQSYAYSKPVKYALEQGLAARQATLKLFKSYPSTRFTP